MKIYISGKITGEDKDDVFLKFLMAKASLTDEGCVVMNPAVLSGNEGFEHEEYMHVCYAMIDVCDAVYMLSDWQKSKGARMELQYSADHNKEILYEDDRTKEPNFPIVYAHPVLEKQPTLRNTKWMYEH